MKIGIIGSGNIGGTLGVLWAKAGHEVLFSSRHPEQLENLVSEAGNGAQAGTVKDAVEFGSVVLLAHPWRTTASLLAELGGAEAFAGKTVIDATNPYNADFSVAIEPPASEGLFMAKMLPQAQVVKAFNTMYARVLKEQGHLPEGRRIAVYYSGDDVPALETAVTLIEDSGFAPVFVGTLVESHLQDPKGPLYGQTLPLREANDLLAQSRRT